MDKIFLWLEKDPARTRKVVLIGTIVVFLIITTAIFGASIFGVVLSDQITALYGTLVALIVGIYGFFTGTSSDKTAKLADKAADLLIEKLDKVK